MCYSIKIGREILKRDWRYYRNLKFDFLSLFQSMFLNFELFAQANFIQANQILF